MALRIADTKQIGPPSKATSAGLFPQTTIHTYKNKLPDLGRFSIAFKNTLLFNTLKEKSCENCLTQTLKIKECVEISRKIFCYVKKLLL